MSFQITSDNIDLSESMKELAGQKLSHIENRLTDIPEDLKFIRVVLNKAPLDKFQSKIEISAGGKKYFAEEIDFTLDTALINAVEEIGKQMDKVRTAQEKMWQEKRKLKIAGDELPNEED